MTVTKKELLGSNTGNIQQIKPKRLKVEDPRIGGNYISRVKAAFNKAGLFEAVEVLTEKAGKG